MANFFTIGPAGGSGGSGGIGTLITPSGNGASDTSALQEAYDAAVDNQTPLYLGGGTWNITSAITQTYQTNDDYVPQIYGSGPGHTILVNATGGDAIFKYQQSADFTYGFGGMLSNMTLRGNGTTGELAIRMRGTWNFTFRSVYFEDFTGGDYVVWYDQPWVGGGGDNTTNANHQYDLCRWDGNTGSDCIYCGESDGTTLTSMAYMIVRGCRAIRGKSFYRGGGRFLLFEVNQFAYMTDHAAITIDQQFGRSDSILIRGNGFEGSVAGEVDLTCYGGTIENNRFTGNYSVNYPSANYDIIRLGNASRDTSRVDIRNNSATYGELEDAASGGSRIYVNFVHMVNCSSVTIDKTQFPSVGGGTFDSWLHTRVKDTAGTQFEISHASIDMFRSQTVQSDSLDSGDTFEANFFRGTYWHVVINATGASPPAYTIANPADSVIDTGSPGQNSGSTLTICIENNSGGTLTDSNFTWGSEYSALALPSIPDADRVFATFITGGRGITSAEKIWQITDWVVH